MPPPPIAAAAHGITYRPLTDADLPFVAELYASTRREEVAATGWPAEMQDTFLRQQHEAQHAHYTAHFTDAEFLIVERDGAPVGRLYVRDMPDRLHIADISLMPDMRGSGVGEAILRDVLAQARESGRKVGVRVEKTNRARRLYERLGFVVTADEGVYDAMEAVP